MTEGKDLLQVLWSGADVLRGKIDANEYKTYLLGLVFYKYLSDSYLSKAYDLLNDEIPDSCKTHTFFTSLLCLTDNFQFCIECYQLVICLRHFRNNCHTQGTL